MWTAVRIQYRIAEVSASASTYITHVSFHAAKNRRVAYTGSVVDGATLARGPTLESSHDAEERKFITKNLDPRALQMTNKTVNEKTGKHGQVTN